MERYLPIEQYGIIGDMHSVALIGTNGSIDWCCLPQFDSPSLFGALLDADKGGYFKIAPSNDGKGKQMYFPDSNVLLTRFLNGNGVGEIVDFMPIETDIGDHRVAHHHQIFRIVKVVRGELEFKLECFPAFNYGRDSHKTHLKKQGAIFASSKMAVALQSSIKLTKKGSGVTARFKLRAGQSLRFVLKQTEIGSDRELLLSTDQGVAAFEKTIDYWRNWLAQSKYHGRWREIVNRSALALKLLTYLPTGAIIAAPTTSLPEAIGGVRNWDYRYTWIRDASFTIYALLRLGFTKEAQQFMKWVRQRCQEVGAHGQLQVLYSIDGQHDITEHVLKHWEGYRGSSPVRIGNAAYKQNQLDIYGELIDSVYIYNKHAEPISYEMWTDVSKLIDYVCRHWKDKDRGIWETRGGSQHFIHSKLMCWVALDRGLRIARARSFPGNWGHWLKTRDAIYREIMIKGWNEQEQAFRQTYGSRSVDASALLMPLVKFLTPSDPRMVSTLKKIDTDLVSDSLVHRYRTHEKFRDGLPGHEGTFSICTFWYAEDLARAGFKHEARYIFDSMLGYANHLGLFSEQIGGQGELLGNFPQAFTHLGLISAAHNLDAALNK